MQEVRAKRPIGRPRGEQVENAAARRKQLVEAAITSIVELGLSATTLATVAKAAGLSQGVAVFYFKSKENLLLEALRYHHEEYTEIWKAAVAAAGEDALDRLIALVLSDLDPTLCTRRNLALWNSFWGEAAARPKYRAICDAYDEERSRALIGICQEAEDLIAWKLWTPTAVAEALDSMTDGMWIRMHISPDYMSLADGRRLLARFLATIYPTEAKRIMARAEAIA